MRRLIRGQRSPWEEGREGRKGDRSLFGGRPRRWPAAPRWESERPRSIGATDRPNNRPTATATDWRRELTGCSPARRRRALQHMPLFLSSEEGE